MAAAPKCRAECLELVREMSFPVVVAPTVGKFISRINSKHLAPHFGAELFLVAILFFGIHFFSKMAADGQNLLVYKFQTSNLIIM